MAYPKHNFIDGQILYAQPLNEMDDQIALNEEATELIEESKMERVVYYLSQSEGVWHLKDKDNNEVSFQTLYEIIRNESNYVVVLMGNSKLRPQYVSQNEIHCDGEDRDSQGTLFLRMIMTPNTLYYGTFRLADKSDLDLKASQEEVDELKNDITNIDALVDSFGLYVSNGYLCQKLKGE